MTVNKCSRLLSTCSLIASALAPDSDLKPFAIGLSLIGLVTPDISNIHCRNDLQEIGSRLDDGPPPPNAVDLGEQAYAKRLRELGYTVVARNDQAEASAQPQILPPEDTHQIP